MVRVLALVGTALLLAGCGREDALDPASPQQHKIVDLFWGMTIGAVFGRIAGEEAARHAAR